MTARTIIRIALATLVLACTAAHAQLFRAYVSSTGSDANPCTLPQPCRLLPAALTAVASGGEIWMLDSANYNAGTVTIAKSVTILAIPGAVGSIVALNVGPAIVVSSGNHNIALRNVVIGPVTGAIAGTNGIEAQGGSPVITIEGSLIANLPNGGIYMTTTGTLRMDDTTVRNNGNYGIYLASGARATISRSRLLGNSLGGVYAVTTTALTTFTVSDSVISGGNVGVGIDAGGASGVARASVTRSTIERSTNALIAISSGSGAATLELSGSMVVNNTNAYLVNGSSSIPATLATLGNNHFAGNGPGTGNGTIATLVAF